MVKLIRVKSPTKPGPDFVEVTDELAEFWIKWFDDMERETERLNQLLDQIKNQNTIITRPESERGANSWQDRA